MKSYFDLEGDGGSNVLSQVLSLKERINHSLSEIKHIVAIGSGKGGVGKSTLTMQLGSALKRQNKQVSLLDADINGPSLARLSGLKDVPFFPGKHGIIIPKSKEGIGVLSYGSMIPESENVDFESVATSDSHVWRATKEFSTLAEILANTVWGKLDYLLIDLPPGADRCFQFAQFLGPNTKFILVTIPSLVAQGVVMRSFTALQKAQAKVLGRIENMSGYYCAGCDQIKPLFPDSTSPLDPLLPLLGSIPFDPELAALCDQGRPFYESSHTRTELDLQNTVLNIESALSKLEEKTL